MKRKYGAALSRETEAEKAQRLRAKEMGDNSNNYGSLSRKGLSITLREPIGLYITGFDDTGWTKPDGSPVDNYWSITRDPC